MTRKENKNGVMFGRRLANAYLSSVISISLVLVLVGIAGLVLANAGRVSRYFKESMKISVMMKEEVSEDQTREYLATIEDRPFVNTLDLITREQGIEEMKQQLGSDFLDVFETAPIPVSVEMTLKAEYVSQDSLEVVKSVIGASPLVDDVVYQRSIVDALNANLRRISLILGIFIILLLFISYVLINNTVRLSVYARRFTVHTMRLVGATRSFIRRPFMRQAFFQGLVAGIIAVGALYGLLIVLKRNFAQLFDIFDRSVQLEVMGFVLVVGVLICLVSTFFIVNRLISLRKAELYY